MESITPSLPSEEFVSRTFNAYGGAQTVSTGSSKQYNSFNTGGTTHNIGGVTGNLTYQYDLALPTQTKFTGVYAPLGLHPVSTYTPRPELEHLLDEQLLPITDADDHNEMRTVVVRGLGGAGKSQLVLNHMHKHRRLYQNVFWIEAGQKQTVERCYLEIYQLLFPNTIHSVATTSTNDAIAAVKNWLHQQEGRSLWVMDSADAIEDVGDPAFIDLNYYLPSGPRLDRIITTRISRAQDMSSQGGVEVREMAEVEAVQLFQKCAKLQQTSGEIKQEIIAIVGELGCLALAVTLAGSYVRETPPPATSILQYLPQYRAHRKRLLDRRAHPNLHQYNASVLSTWEMSFAAIERQSPLAARLLSLLAFINFEDIFLSLFCVDRDSLAPSDVSIEGERVQWVALLLSGDGALDTYDIKAGFAILQAYSLLTWREEQEAYAMHKLVHAWSHDRLKSEQRQAWSLAALELLDEIVSKEDVDLARDLRLVPHVMVAFALTSAVYRSALPLPERSREAMGRLADLLNQLGRWDNEYDVRVFLEQVVETACGQEHLETAESMDRLAAVLTAQGKYEQAEEMFRRTITLRERLQGPEHPDTLSSFHNLAMALSEQGKYKQAEDIQRRVLRLKENVVGVEHPSTISSLSNLGTIFLYQGKYSQAEEVFLQQLELCKKLCY
ncbi:hypothetical protein H2198_005794 [Neophaeococcomyces mojaviensis]|uniref:Uncharacterized protein n=1 Tax=Neophaeococcomyces mojaviensis TaxID=3383035 RepID=A0ACC3A4T1_9EURO|nr:hypothetical protein H2198_005794 [Knufia sp. JES_112]